METENLPLTYFQHILHAFSHLHRGTFSWRLNRGWRKYQERRRLAWWQANCAGFEHLDISIQPGLRMRLYADSHLSREIFTGHFEPRERLFFNLFLRPGDTFVDVGANIGLFTLIAANCLGSSGKVYAFEPHPLAAARLKENLQINALSNVVLRQSALSDQEGDVALSLSDDDSLSALQSIKVSSDEKIELVKTICWDDYALEQKLIGKVTLMKIDVEGWEMHVLNGARQTLSRSDAPTIQIEFNDDAARLAGSSCQALYQALQSLGYQLFRFDEKIRQLISEAPAPYYAYANLFATKQVDVVNQRLHNGRRPFWLR